MARYHPWELKDKVMGDIKVYVFTEVRDYESVPVVCEQYVFSDQYEAEKKRDEIIDGLAGGERYEITNIGDCEFSIYDKKWQERTWVYVSEIEEKQIHYE